MILEIIFFKESGKFNRREVLPSIYSDNIKIYDTDSIIKFIESRFGSDSDYVFIAKNRQGGEINYRLVKKLK